MMANLGEAPHAPAARMRRSVALALASVFAWAALPAGAAATAGQAAPGFTLSDTAGKNVSLSDFKGRTVVLEWINPGCPFVQKHYRSANMPATQKAAADKGVVWLAINSTATSATDYLAPAALASWMQQHQAQVVATLMDADGRVGKAYGARTTPQMVIIDPQGVIRYAGAIDSKPTAKVEDIASATNHVQQALTELLSGKPVSVPVTRPYGCSVKYAS